MTTPVDPIGVAAVVVGVLERLGISTTIAGSTAASFAGEPRSTVDIDVVPSLEEGHVAALVAALSPDFYVDEDAVRRAVRQAPILGVTALLAQALAQADSGP